MCSAVMRRSGAFRWRDHDPDNQLKRYFGVFLAWKRVVRGAVRTSYLLVKIVVNTVVKINGSEQSRLARRANGPW